MQISDKQLDAFIELYRDKFGITLDRVKALELGLKLVNLMRVITKSHAR